jgi:hypothetical protein
MGAGQCTGGDGAGPSDQAAAARYDKELAEKAAAAKDVDVELSQEMEALASPSKSPAPKKPKKDGDGGSSSQAVELDSSDHECASIGGEDFAVDEEQFEEQTRMQIDKSIDDIA